MEEQDNPGRFHPLYGLRGRFGSLPDVLPKRRFEETAQSKIFPVHAFGYRRITIERPLRLAFQVTPERVKAALAEKALQKLEGDEQSCLITALNGMNREAVYLSQSKFTKALKDALAVQDLVLKPTQLNVLLNAFGERHPEAEICKSKGKPEPDSGLRDYENVPLGESIYDYFEREVKPHVPDAWIDEDKRDELDGEVGIVGFEIPFNRHFYVFEPPRPLEEIDRDLKACTDRIKQMIEELSA